MYICTYTYIAYILHIYIYKSVNYLQRENVKYELGLEVKLIWVQSLFLPLLTFAILDTLLDLAKPKTC